MKKEELIARINEDKKNYRDNEPIREIYKKITNNKEKQIEKSIICARKYRFYSENRSSIINKIKFIYYAKKNNILSNRNQIELYGRFGKNLKIYHSGIIVNKSAIIGDNVKMHGLNCIGNNGDSGSPIIGNNVDIGVGAVIIGNIEIADNIIIGANAVVNKSFKEEGITIAGVPARKIKG